jgi:hypothetical protein
MLVCLRSAPKYIYTNFGRVCVASWVRVYYLVIFTISPDTTWVSGETATWSSIEASLGIVSACLPVLRPLYQKIRNKADVLSKPTKNDSSGSQEQSNSFHRLNKWENSDRKTFGRQGSDDAINLTNFVSGGPQEEGLSADRIMVRSEIRQAHSYV